MLTEIANWLRDLTHPLSASLLVSKYFIPFHVVVVLYLLWRAWAFTLHPLFHPTEPKELPYWIPSHAFSFLKDSQGLIDRGREYFHNNDEAFALTVGGQKLYVLLSPNDVGAIYRNNTTLSWDAMLDELLVAFGVNAMVIPRMWAKPEESRESLRNPNLPPGLSAIHSTLELYKKQLLPGPKLDTLSDTLLGHISNLMPLYDGSFGQGSPTGVLSLKDFCASVLVDSLTRTLFGEHIRCLEPNIVQCLLEFNDDAWMLVFKYPQSANSKLNVARNKILKGFEKYLDSPENVRLGKSWLIDEVMKMLSSVDINNDDRAAMLLMIYWAANINPYKLAFWMLTYILFDPKLHAVLREETSHAYKDGDIDLPYLMAECPRLDAVYLEVLRIVNTALSARKIVAPTPLGDKVLRSGNTILIAFKQLHSDRAVYGADPMRFDPDRFLKDKNLKNSSSYKPFGGGVNYCPGRFLAKQEMLVFVALVLNRYNIQLATRTSRGKPMSRPQQFPQLDMATPALGVNGSTKGTDVWVELGKWEGKSLA
ncbi:MAG: hypothetical protein Q9166_007434 [cf. Caloplaca sp. 2 TL-2023]